MKGCRPLSDEEITVVSRSFGGTYAARDRALFILGLKSGFRISELLSLRVGDVLQHGRLVDQVTVRRAHMKQRTEGRTVPVHAEAKQALAARVDGVTRRPICFGVGRAAIVRSAVSRPGRSWPRPTGPMSSPANWAPTPC